MYTLRLKKKRTEDMIVLTMRHGWMYKYVYILYMYSDIVYTLGAKRMIFVQHELQ